MYLQEFLDKNNLKMVFDKPNTDYPIRIYKIVNDKTYDNFYKDLGELTTVILGNNYFRIYHVNSSTDDNIEISCRSINKKLKISTETKFKETLICI